MKKYCKPQLLIIYMNDNILMTSVDDDPYVIDEEEW